MPDGPEIRVVFSPWIREQRQPFPSLPAAGRPAASAPEDERCREVRFRADGEEIAGSLYLPQNVEGRGPCVVLNHGLGGTRDAVVGQYASRFAQAGMAALTYDYRLGASGGQPRQLFLLDPRAADCWAAIAYVRSLPEIDAERIASGEPRPAASMDCGSPRRTEASRA